MKLPTNIHPITVTNAMLSSTAGSIAGPIYALVTSGFEIEHRTDNVAYRGLCNVTNSANSEVVRAMSNAITVVAVFS